MRIGIIGTGYVGLVYGAVMSSFDHSVICMDKDWNKINLLKLGEVLIYEPGLKEYVEAGLTQGQLSFTASLEECVENSDYIFIAVGTPANSNGGVNLSYVMDVADQIGRAMNGNKLIVSKSTVPVGTCRSISGRIDKILKERNADYKFVVASNPEFLRQGTAVQDCMSPSRVIIGTESDAARQALEDVYRMYDREQVPFLFTQTETAELIKYASNAFLAVKISFANEIALLSEKIGTNVRDVMRGIGLDERISPAFLNAGPGYGGSCFPKDATAIVETGQLHGEEMLVIQAAIKANEQQKARMVRKIRDTLSENGSLKGFNIAVLGLSFKPETDDIRNAPSHDIIEGLISSGATINAYCPEGMRQAQNTWYDLNNSVHYCINELACAENMDAIVLITEWKQFRELDWAEIKSHMRNNYLFDLRSMFDAEASVKEQFQYYAVGMGGA